MKSMIRMVCVGAMVLGATAVFAADPLTNDQRVKWLSTVTDGCYNDPANWVGGDINGVFGSDLTCGHGDKCSLVAQGVQRGCFTFSVRDRRPGEIVGISFCSKGRHVSATVGWKRDGKWDWTIPTVTIPIASETDADGWTQTDWAVTVPDDADGFALMLGVGQDAGEKCWFDDVMVIPMPRN